MKQNYSRTAAALTAVAISEAFPGSEFLGGEATARGFACQFYYSFSLPPEALPMLEERMRQIVRENRPIKEMEMVSYCAKELFLKLGRKAAVDALKDCAPKDLVSVLQIGNFHELMEGPFCPSIRDVGAFKITALEFLGEGLYRVEGCAFATKIELKEYVRKLSAYVDVNHISRAQRLGLLLFDEEGYIWKEKGLKVKRNLVSFFQKYLLGEEVSYSDQISLRKYALSKVGPQAPFICWNQVDKAGVIEGSEGFFEGESQSFLQQIIYCNSDELQGYLISLLQTIDKTLIILGFHAHIQLSSRKKGEKALTSLESAIGKGCAIHFDGHPGARAQWVVLDGLGREQVAVELGLPADQSALCVKLGIEKILALLLEQTGECLPGWLSSEQVRVLALESAQLDYAKEVKRLLEMEGFKVSLDCRSAPLKLRLRDAAKDGLPFTLVVGEKELETNTVALRERGSERSEPMRLSQLIERMKRTFDFEKTKY